MSTPSGLKPCARLLSRELLDLPHNFAMFVAEMREFKSEMNEFKA